MGRRYLNGWGLIKKYNPNTNHKYLKALEHFKNPINENLEKSVS